MDTLIQKIDILHPTLIEVIKYNGPMFIFLLIFVNVGTLLTIAITSDELNFNKQNIIESIIQSILIIFVITGLLLTAGYNNYPKKNYTNLKLTQLNEIQNLIHVQDNKLTIDNLPEYFRYTNDKYDKNTIQTFKIEHDNFFNTYKLIDKNNNIIEISKEEYEKLIKGSTNKWID